VQPGQPLLFGTVDATQDRLFSHPHPSPSLSAFTDRQAGVAELTGLSASAASVQSETSRDLFLRRCRGNFIICLFLIQQMH